jgi:hypothetical protein
MHAHSNSSQASPNGLLASFAKTLRVGQNRKYMVYVRYFWQDNHQISGHMRGTYMALANPLYFASTHTSLFTGKSQRLAGQFCKNSLLCMCAHSNSSQASPDSLLATLTGAAQIFLIGNWHPCVRGHALQAALTAFSLHCF